MTHKTNDHIPLEPSPMTKDTPRNQRQRELIAKLRAARNITDSDVAKLLGTSKTIISKVQARKRELTLPQEIMLFDLLGYTWTREMVLKILPETVANQMRAWDNERSNANLGRDEEIAPVAPAPTGHRHA